MREPHEIKFMLDTLDTLTVEELKWYAVSHVLVLDVMRSFMVDMRLMRDISSIEIPTQGFTQDQCDLMARTTLKVQTAVDRLSEDYARRN